MKESKVTETSESQTIQRSRSSVIAGKSGFYLEQTGPLLAIILFGILMAILAPRFFNPQNIINVLYSASLLIVLAMGMTFVITGAGIDISIGANLALVGVLISYYLKFTNWPELLAIPMGLILGALFGTFNGFIITRLKIPDFIATIATQIGFRGIVLILAGGFSFYEFPKTFIFLGKYRVFGYIPMPIIVSIIVVLFSYFLYHWTAFGRYTIAMGSNKESAMLSGINVNKYKILTFAYSGFLAGLAAILMIGRLDSYHASFGQNIELEIIASVIIGGTALFGGLGKIWGSVTGAILLAMVTNGLVILKLPFFYQYVAISAVIIISVGLYSLRKKRGA